MAPTNRVKCKYCSQTYALIGASLRKHLETKHWTELVRDQPEKYSSAEANTQHKAPTRGDAVHAIDPIESVATAFQGAEIITDIAKRIRSVHQKSRQQLETELELVARELDKLAFALNFLYTDLRASNMGELREKAKKWDTLVGILPTIEAFLKLAQEKEVKDV